jgi:hypothetical protein
MDVYYSEWLNWRGLGLNVPARPLTPSVLTGGRAWSPFTPIRQHFFKLSVTSKHTLGSNHGSREGSDRHWRPSSCLASSCHSRATNEHHFDVVGVERVGIEVGLLLVHSMKLKV